MVLLAAKESPCLRCLDRQNEQKPCRLLETCEKLSAWQELALSTLYNRMSNSVDHFSEDHQVLT
jgi:hypothetical protein